MLDNLRKHHVMVVEWCSIFKWNGKSVDHLLPHHDVVSMLWQAIFKLCGLNWDDPLEVSRPFSMLEGTL